MKVAIRKEGFDVTGMPTQRHLRARARQQRGAGRPSRRVRVSGGYEFAKSQTPWQDFQRMLASQMSTSSEIEPAATYQRLALTHATPRDSR